MIFKQLYTNSFPNSSTFHGFILKNYYKSFLGIITFSQNPSEKFIVWMGVCVAQMKLTRAIVLFVFCLRTASEAEFMIFKVHKGLG